MRNPQRIIFEDIIDDVVLSEILKNIGHLQNYINLASLCKKTYHGTKNMFDKWIDKNWRSSMLYSIHISAPKMVKFILDKNYDPINYSIMSFESYACNERSREWYSRSRIIFWKKLGVKLDDFFGRSHIFPNNCGVPKIFSDFGYVAGSQIGEWNNNGWKYFAYVLHPCDKINVYERFENDGSEIPDLIDLGHTQSRDLRTFF